MRRKRRSQPLIRSHHKLPSLKTFVENDISEADVLEKKIEVRHSIDFISELVNSLETYNPEFEFITMQEAHYRVDDISNDKIYRLEPFHPASSFNTFSSTYKDKSLEDMVGEMQETLENLVKERSSTLHCLDTIDDLLNTLDNRIVNRKEKTKTTVKIDKETQKSMDSNVKPQDLRESFSNTMENLSHMQFNFILSPTNCVLAGKKTSVECSGSLFQINEQLQNLEVCIEEEVKEPPPNVQKRLTRTFTNKEKNYKESGLVRKLTFKDKIAPNKDREVVYSKKENRKLNFMINLSLKNLEDFSFTEVRDLPTDWMAASRHSLQKLQYIVWKMPEISEFRMKIEDILNFKYLKENFNLLEYRKLKKKINAKMHTEIRNEIQDKLNLYQELFKHRTTLRQVFVSYNLESLSEIQEVFYMKASSFHRLMNDLMLITDTFSNIDAMKQFYIACSDSKGIASNVDSNWIEHLLAINRFEATYKLTLPRFIEALIRVIHVHPRYTKLDNLELFSKFSLFFNRDFKPCVRVSPFMLYQNLSSDANLIEILASFQSKMYRLFTQHAMTSKLSYASLVEIFKDLGLMKKTEIRNEMNNLGLSNVSDNTYRTIPEIYKHRFDNTHVFIPIESLKYGFLAFSKPVRPFFKMDKFTLFSAYCAIALDTNDFLVNEHEFSLNFNQFCDLFMMVCTHKWKTSSCHVSLIENAYLFLNSILEASMITPRKEHKQKRMNLSLINKPIVSATVFPQEIFHRRRASN